jgi:hypothetical protein
VTFKGKRLGDQIESLLYVQNKLKASLGLPIATEGMLYPGMASIDDTELQEIEQNARQATEREIDVLTQEAEVDPTNPWSMKIVELWTDYLISRNADAFKEILPADDKPYSDFEEGQWIARRNELIQKLTLQALSQAVHSTQQYLEGFS